jgi:hypothetical protein
VFVVAFLAACGGEGTNLTIVELSGRYVGDGVDAVVSACYGAPRGDALWLQCLPMPPGWTTSPYGNEAGACGRSVG